MRHSNLDFPSFPSFTFFSLFKIVWFFSFLSFALAQIMRSRSSSVDLLPKTGVDLSLLTDLSITGLPATTSTNYMLAPGSCDVNGDGFADILGSFANVAFVALGRGFFPPMDPTPFNGTNGWLLEADSEVSGIACLGHIDNSSADGFAVMTSGDSYIVDGDTTAPQHGLLSQLGRKVINAANGIGGFFSLGDVNDDGVSDVFVADKQGGGRVVYGPFVGGSVIDLTSTAGFNVQLYPEAQSSLRLRATGVDNFKGDGTRALVFAPYTISGLGTSGLSCYVLWGGGDQTDVVLSQLDPEHGLEVGATYFDLIKGWHVGAGDVNRDGLGDFAFVAEHPVPAAAFFIPASVPAYVLHGNSSFGPSVDLLSLGPQQGLRLLAPVTVGWSGTSIEMTDCGSVLIGARRDVAIDPFSLASYAGTFFVFNNHTQSVSNGIVDLSSLGDSQGGALIGSENADYADHVVRFIGNFHGNGDLVIATLVQAVGGHKVMLQIISGQTLFPSPTPSPFLSLSGTPSPSPTPSSSPIPSPSLSPSGTPLPSRSPVCLLLSVLHKVTPDLVVTLCGFNLETGKFKSCGERIDVASTSKQGVSPALTYQGLFRVSDGQSAVKETPTPKDSLTPTLQRVA